MAITAPVESSSSSRSCDWAAALKLTGGGGGEVVVLCRPDRYVGPTGSKSIVTCVPDRTEKDQTSVSVVPSMLTKSVAVGPVSWVLVFALVPITRDPPTEIDP